MGGKINTLTITLLFIIILINCVLGSSEFNPPEVDINFEELEKDLLEGHGSLEFLAENSCKTRGTTNKPDYFSFLPTGKAHLTTPGQSHTFVNRCFQYNIATLEIFTRQEIVITIEASQPISWLCSDIYWIATSNIHKIKSIFLHGKHTIQIKNISQDDYDEILVNGIRVLGFCQDSFKEIYSLVKTLHMYVGALGKNPNATLPIFRPEIPEYMKKANIEFMQEYSHWRPIPRSGEFAQKITDIDEKDIDTGDLIAIMRLDGVDQIIIAGTGTYVAHMAVACRIDGELYILESQDAWYWPRRGIQKNKWKDWTKFAKIADFNVALLKMKDEYQKKLNAEQAIKWFHSGIEGLNYGFHNFIFSWLDTPDKNLPRFLEQDVVLPLFSIFEKISKTLANYIIVESLNIRMSTKGLTISKVVAEAARKGIKWEELLALPEIEGWEYSDGKNYVCSCFVVAFYKAAGLFGDMEINSTEFTPKDVYQLDFFDREWKDKRPKACKEADPELDYCMVVGKYTIELPGFGTIKPYSNMNERCPSIGPDFYRPDGC